MVKSSIVVPRQAATAATSKRSIDQDSPTDNHDNQESSTTKRPRMELTDDGKKRGQRLFGALLGTLNKFKSDSEQNSAMEKKRQEIDSKLHEKLATERKELAEEMSAERERRAEESASQQRRARRELDEKREATAVRQHELLASFLKTNSTPVLCYRPAKLTDTMQKVLDEQRDEARQRRKSYEERRESRMAEEENQSSQSQRRQDSNGSGSREEEEEEEEDE